MAQMDQGLGLGGMIGFGASGRHGQPREASFGLLGQQDGLVSQVSAPAQTKGGVGVMHLLQSLLQRQAVGADGQAQGQCLVLVLRVR